MKLINARRNAKLVGSKNQKDHIYIERERDAIYSVCSKYNMT